MNNFLIFATKNGLVKKTDIEEYQNIRRSGLIAIKLEKEDNLLDVRKTQGEDEIILVSQQGKSIKFHEGEVRNTGRSTRGVKGIKIRPTDKVVSLLVVDQEKSPDQKGAKQLLIVTEKGFGKRTLLSQYSRQGRGGQGVFTAKINDKTGEIVGACLVDSKDQESDLLISSAKGQIIRLPLKDVPNLGRHTQGVKLIRLDKQDSVSSFTLMTANED